MTSDVNLHVLQKVIQINVELFMNGTIGKHPMSCVVVIFFIKSLKLWFQMDRMYFQHYHLLPYTKPLN